MSKVKIQGNASGTGVLTITAPNTSTDRTITLPDTTGTLLDENSSVPAANLTGTVADARISALTASKLTGALPAISGASLTNLPASGISDLTPYFTAYSGGNQVPSSGVTTKITFAELDDSDSAYDGSNSKFTVPSGEGGKYFITTGGTFYSNASNRVTDAVFKVYKNGSQVSGGLMPLGSQYSANPGANAVSSSFQMLLTLAAGDYVEIYGYVTTNSGAVSFGARTFSGFKIGT